MVTPHPPSVDALARGLDDIDLPQALLVDAVRQAIAAGDPASARGRAEAVAAARLRPVINATGVLLHTNLGRAPLEVHHAGVYRNLEFDLTNGQRGSRGALTASLLARVVGAEAALVVNNGAAAVLLVLAALAPGRKVLVSRGELVEIGGGFRIPDVMAASGAEMVEVGTTNRTRLADYRGAVDGAALVLKVHRSNYRTVGFTEEVAVPALAGLGPPVVYDVGSGLLDADVPWLPGPPPAWLAGEPAVRQSLEQGADLVTFSGDKLMGGPQAGIIVGRADLVGACARHPLARALRAGGLVLSALQDLALAYLRRDGQSIPFWRMASVPAEMIRARVEELAAALASTAPGRPDASTSPGRPGPALVTECASVPGGGSVPGTEIPSWGLALSGDRRASLRRAEPTPVVARVEAGRTILDLRTVDPADDKTLMEVIAALSPRLPA